MKLEIPQFVTLVFALAALSASGATLVYEGFDYSDGTIDGVSTFNGGTGFSGAWAGSTSNVPFSMSDGTGHSHGGAGQPGLDFGSLSTTGTVTLTRKSAPGGAEVHRTLDSGVATTLTTSTTMYFSVLVRTKFYSVGNENLTFAFGTGEVFDPNQKPVTKPGATSDSLGFALVGSGSNIDFWAHAVEDGVTSTSATAGLAHSTSTVWMMVGKIDWGVTDTITLYQNSGGNDGSTGSTDWADFSEFASLEADVDESAFNTLHIAGQQVSSIDEIRMGTSLDDVGVEVIPEPSTALLTLLGGLFLLRRKR